jgi:hypothetical protein
VGRRAPRVISWTLRERRRRLLSTSRTQVWRSGGSIELCLGIAAYKRAFLGARRGCSPTLCLLWIAHSKGSI